MNAIRSQEGLVGIRKAHDPSERSQKQITASKGPYSPMRLSRSQLMPLRSRVVAKGNVVHKNAQCPESIMKTYAVTIQIDGLIRAIGVP